MDQDQIYAPGWPGIPPKWTSSAKTGVGTSLNPASRVWFTLSHGIIDEIYYPRLDLACTRDMGFIVTDGDEFFSEEKRATSNVVKMLAKGVPAYQMTNTCVDKRYRIEKQIISDPWRDVVLQRTHFEPLVGSLQDYHLYILLAPHLNNKGSQNTAWIGDYKGNPMLFAQNDDTCLALACSSPWLHRSAGFVGSSDGWQDINQHKKMTWFYQSAENGNVALTAEIDLASSNGDFILALGFGTNPSEAGLRAISSLHSDFEKQKKQYIQGWQNWQQRITPLESDDGSPDKPDLYHISAAVMRIHEAKRFPGGTIASLSIPWGFSKGDDDLGGYHLVWPRDLAETAGGLLAAGAKEDVRKILYYLQATQEADGHWPQNMWLDGRPYWQGIQLDETAFPILLVDLAARQDALLDGDLNRLWPMVRRAASFLVTNGPVTQQDRWEEDPGYSPFTLAVEIAALLAAADMAEDKASSQLAAFLRETADYWNESIERWTYVENTDLAKQIDVDGYYVRIAPPDTGEAGSPAEGFVPIKNRPINESSEPASYIVSPDALALVRFGLRSADDPHILNTIRVIDSLLKVETSQGPVWHRYNDDGYGEHKDGQPFDGTGIGRGWPLLTSERAHYELAAGHRQEAIRLMQAVEHFSNAGGLIPEQVWDTDDIPEAELFFGKPSGSAMPLVWAHAEYVKLRRSLVENKVFDMPPQTFHRYIEHQTKSNLSIWRTNLKVQNIQSGKTFRIELFVSGSLEWSTDDWETKNQSKLKDTGVGIWLVDIPIPKSFKGKKLHFRTRGDDDSQPFLEDIMVTIQ